MNDQRKADVARARSRYDADLGSESHITEADMDHLSWILNDLWDRADAGNAQKLAECKGARAKELLELCRAAAKLKAVRECVDRHRHGHVFAGHKLIRELDAITNETGRGEQ